MQVSKIRDFSPKKLESFIVELGEKPYRARQVCKWLYQKEVTSFDEMTDLSVETRDKIKSIFDIEPSLKILDEQKSTDGTIKYLFELSDSNRIESVIIPEKKRFTLCISSQVGCALACRFCLTGTVGKIRNLDTSEIIDQYLFISNRLPGPITNIVFMGMGEPLDNIEKVIDTIEILTDKNSIGMSPKRITVSTAGLVSGIKELGKRISVNLSISLNASNDKTRDEVMPINKKYPIKKLINTAIKYPLPSRKTLTFEYVLLKGVNDSAQNAYEVVELLRGINCKINLIPFNEAYPLPYKTPEMNRVYEFQKILENAKINAKIRKSRGRDILGACGQLAAKYPHKILDRKKVQNADI